MRNLLLPLHDSAASSQLSGCIHTNVLQCGCTAHSLPYICDIDNHGDWGRRRCQPLPLAVVLQCNLNTVNMTSLPGDL